MQVVDESLEPALEVPSFPWPEEIDALLHRQPAHWDQLARELTGADVPTSNILAVTGSARGEGRTTTLLCLARALVRQGAKTVVVDADFSSPTLATQLGLGVRTGWEDAIRGSIPLCDAMILSEEDRLALLPLVGTDPNLAELAGHMQVAIHLRMLAEKYHTVLVDLGPVESPESPALRLLHGIGSAGVVLIDDQRGTDSIRKAEVTRRVRLSGVTILGMIENFASPRASSSPTRPTAQGATAHGVSLAGETPVVS
jgi:Mrp family chromosome partitioning ATPase